MNFSVQTIGADLVEKTFKVAAATIEARCEKKVRHFAQILETRIKANASGRPGPNAPTGDYVRSWNTQYGRRNGGFAAIVGTNKPQGRRLEHGFVGTDSLGRHYNQPPFPHVAPAVAAVEDPFQAAILAEATRGV